MDIITSISLLGYCLAIRRFVRWPIEMAPFFVVSTVIILFYFFAYFGILKIGSLLFILGGGICVLTSPFYLPHQRNELLKEYFTPGMVILVFFILLFGVMAHQITVMDWDELTCWLPHARSIYLNHGFWTAGNIIVDPDYPPGGALFGYLFTRLGGFAEGRLYFAQLFLLLTPITILFRKYRWANWSNAFIVFSLILLLCILLFKIKIGAKATLYMDAPTGLFIGGILAAYYIFNNSRSCWLYLWIPTMALVLFRPMLLPFVAIIASLILIDQFYLWKKDLTHFSSIFLYSGIFILPFLISISWQHYVSKYLGSNIKWHLGSLLGPIKNHALVLSSEQFHTILPAYIYAVIQAFIMMAVILFLAAWVYRNTHDLILKRRILIAHVWLAVGYVSYIFLLLLFYFYLMPPAIVMEMNSFQRFLDIYNMGWLMLLWSQAWYFARQSFSERFSSLSTKMKNIIALIIIVTAISYAGFIDYSQDQRFEAKRSTLYIRHEIKTQLSPLDELLTPQDKLGVLWHGWGLVPNIISYELFPHSVTILNEDMGSKNDFIAQMRQVNYILIGGNINPTFWQEYGKFFNTRKISYTELTLCTDDVFDRANYQNCKLQQIPLHLYKVEFKHGKLKLIAILKPRA